MLLNSIYHMKHPLSSYIKPCHNYILWQHVTVRSVHAKSSFFVSEEYHCVYRKLSNSLLLLLLHQNMLFLVFLISTIVKCDLLRIVITLYHAHFLSKRSKSRHHPSPIHGKSLFLLLICSFCVSSCDKKKRLGNIKHTTRFIMHPMEWKFIWDPIHILQLNYDLGGNKNK